MITLTTDFGLADHFVGTMKGVIATIAPQAAVADITHLVEPFSILDGAFTIAETYAYWPKKTIHVVVVDPGVGTSRRPILFEAANQFFIGPDNGVFSLIYAREPKHKVRAITNEKFFLPVQSRTFHGRDIFAPCAAHLANGAPPPQFGKLITDPVTLPNLVPQQSSPTTWTGLVLKVDHFGNLITNFRAADFSRFKLQVNNRVITRLATNYQDNNTNELFALTGSSGYLEISATQASAAALLGCQAQAPVELSLW